MTDTSKPAEAADQTRRAFFRKSAEVAVTAPAVAVLLSATTKSAKAQTIYSGDFVGLTETQGAAFNGGIDDAPQQVVFAGDDGFDGDSFAMPPVAP